MNDLQNVHKYQRGGVLICASPSQSKIGLGASLLAARASFRVGAGIVMLALENDSLIPAQVSFPEVVVLKLDDIGDFLSKTSSIVCGPGWLVEGQTEQSTKLLRKLLNLKKPIVIDAGAIDVVAANDDLWNELHEKCILTPHEGEVSRLLKIRKKTSLLELAKTTKVTIIEKGSRTVVLQNDLSWTLDKPNRKLAVAGSGDVLAGAVAGLWAQRPEDSAFSIAKLAVQLHSKAGKKIHNGAIAHELADELSNIET